MIFSMFDARAAKEFGVSMAKLFMQRMPLSAGLNDKQFGVKSLQVFAKMGQEMAAFKQHNPLNTYKIAQMGNAFKWELKDAGYDGEYVDKLTQLLVSAVK
jgi:hypothetical protein